MTRSRKGVRIALIYNTVAPGEPAPANDGAGFAYLLRQMRQMARALRKYGHSVHMVPLGTDLLAFQRGLKKLSPDLVFNQYEDTLPGANFEMRVAGLVQMMGIPITGSPALALGLTKSKYMCACLLSGTGVPIPPDTRLLQTVGAVDRYSWEFPVIVHPGFEDGGIGLAADSIVSTKKALRDKVRQLLREFDQPVLAQRYLVGREFNVGIVGGYRPRVLPLAEVDFSGVPDGIPRIMSYAAKWVKDSPEYKGTRVVCPAYISPALERRIGRIALKTFQAVGAWGYARVDIRLDERNRPHVLEINCNPCLEAGMGLGRSALRARVTYAKLLDLVVRSALERKNRGPRLTLPEPRRWDSGL